VGKGRGCRYVRSSVACQFVSSFLFPLSCVKHAGHPGGLLLYLPLNLNLRCAAEVLDIKIALPSLIRSIGFLGYVCS
jgi:hypothetical protein